ncbi:hypothetical protein DSO57_1015541 [Entomophthora muscae]|uniref:Uncharacterized protein n=1 Tax=Entomophthora muscae TaxID=34485 RepID=A0ACC2S6W4_9FUNG|nr:hypothetical protein DSO57_1015541 [Entomophthora muscae]
MFSPLRAISSIAQSFVGLAQDSSEDWAKDSDLDGETLTSYSGISERMSYSFD